MKTYLVGGAVRDQLLGIEVYDRDWVVLGATPEQMLQQGFQQVGKDFPVFLHPESKQEYALARTERKSGKGYHGFEVCFDSTVTLEEDLIRRDLTINAMAQSEKGEIIDPYNGQQDLQAKCLRHVSNAFEEDPLRVLRVARFAAKLKTMGFSIADETLQLMQKMTRSGELKELTPERVWQEVVKALATESPSTFFEVLYQVGALQDLFPELEALIGVEQPVKYHPEGDVWVHTLMVLQASVKLTDDLQVRFAALMHDLGKGLTPKALWPKHHGHEQAGIKPVKKICERYRVPKKMTEVALLATELHGVVHQALDSENKPHLKPSTFLKVLKKLGALKRPERLEQILLVGEADSKGRLGFEEKPYQQKKVWREILSAVQKVDNQVFVKQGLKGKEIAQAIENEQLILIQKCIQSYR